MKQLRPYTILLIACLWGIKLASSVLSSNCHDSPAIDAHLGIWEGTYRYYDAQGNLQKQHQSKLTLQRECNRWIQQNEYYYADGKTERLNFEAEILEDGSLVFDIGRVIGEAWGSKSTVLFEWQYQGKDDLNFEMINLIGSDRRMRSWQLSENGEPTGFVQITEQRVQDWE